MAAHLDSSRNERGRQVSTSQVIKFDEPVKQEEVKQEVQQEKPVERKVEQPKQEPQKVALCRVERGCLTLGYDFNLYVEFNNLDLSALLVKMVNVDDIDKIELYSEKNENSIFLIKSFITHYKLGEVVYKGIIFTSFELQSKCYPKMILLVSGNEQRLIYSQRRM